MTGLETWTLWVHIAAGTVAICGGVVAILTEKGGHRHRLAGKTFVAAMAIVVTTTVLLLAFDPGSFRVFLTLVAVFSGYLAFSGYRVLGRKRPDDTATSVDWIAAGSVVLACLGLGGWGVRRLLAGSTFGVVLVVFGAIGLAFGLVDLRAFQADRSGSDSGAGGPWILTHLQRMIAAFIATVTAVSAVNLGSLGAVAWLWPTVAFTPLIVYWSQKYDPRDR